MAPKQPNKLDSLTTSKSTKKAGKKSRKLGRNLVKCAKYRSRVGKPRGRGVPGNKRGKNKQ